MAVRRRQQNVVTVWRRGSISRILFPRETPGVTTILLVPPLPAGSCDLTRGPVQEGQPGPAIAHASAGKILLFGLAPDGVCPHLRLSPRWSELLPRRFTLTAAYSREGSKRRRSAFCGTFPRSLGAAVSGHPVLRSPDFPLPE